MDIIDALKKRRSIRSFKTQEIEKDKVDILLRMAMQAPSARDQMPWHFIVLSDRAILNELAEKLSNANMLKEAPLCIILVTDKRKLLSPDLYAQDMAAATQNLLLAATGLGLGSVWMGTYPNKEKMKIVASLISLPKDFEFFSMVALGYPKYEKDFEFIDNYDAKRIHYDEF